MDIYLSKIKKQSKRYDVDIRVDKDTYSFKITDDLLIEMMFLSPKPLKESEYKSFLNKLPLDSLVYEGIKFVDKKMRSEKETRDHLYSLSSSSSLVDDAIQVLKRKNLINDERYKDAYLEYAIYTKRDGRIKISENLSLLGLNQFFDYPIDAIKENIKVLSSKYIQKNHDIPYKTLIMKTKMHLLSKGYTEGEIDKFLNISLFPKGCDSDLIQKDYKKLKMKYKDDIDKLKQALLRKGYSLSLIEKVVRGTNNE